MKMTWKFFGFTYFFTYLLLSTYVRDLRHHVIIRWCSKKYLYKGVGLRGCVHKWYVYVLFTYLWPDSTWYPFDKVREISSTLLMRPLPKVEGESQNLRLINHHFTTVSSHFFSISIWIFHKTEIQTVILRCWMGL